MKSLFRIFFIGSVCLLHAVDSPQFKAFHEVLHVPSKEENALRIVTWNVQKKIQNLEGEHILDQILADLEKIQPDVLLFQEAFQNLEEIGGERREIFHEWEREFALRGYSVVKCYPGQEDLSKRGSLLRNQCLSFITNQEVLSLHCQIFPVSLQHPDWENSQFGFQEVLLNTHLGKIRVFNVHLIPRENGKKRSEQIKMLLDYMQRYVGSQIPIFVAGDYNSLNYRQIVQNGQLEIVLQQDIDRKVSTPLYELEALYQAGFREVYDIAEEKAPWVTVWSLRRVDYIFAKNTESFLIRPFVLKRVYSDHFPLSIDITNTEIK